MRLTTRLVMALVMTLVTVPTVQAQLYCAPIDKFLPFFSIASVTVATAIAFLYMLAHIFVRKDLIALANEEMRQLIISVVLAVGLFSGAALICTASAAVMKEFAEGGYANQFDYAISYLRDYIIADLGFPTITKIWLTQLAIKYGAHFEVKEKIRGRTFGFEANEALEPISAALDVVGNFIFTPMLISLHVQLILLNFAQAFGMTVLLPVGVVLRVIPQTREAGCFFLAAAFGLYVVYPFLYVVNYNITKTHLAKGVDEGAKAVTEIMKREITPWMPFKIFGDTFWRVFIRGAPPFDLALLLIHAIVIPLLVISLTVGFISIFADFLKEIG